MPHATNSSISAPSLVIVTGANGFIASHTIHALLTQGYHVCGTVRSQSKADGIKATIEQLLPDAAHRFSTATIPNITDSSAYLSLFQTTNPAAILHLASPFAYTVTSFERDLMEPAVQGTTAVLTAALATPSARRVVHTNSFACIYDAALGLRPGYTYTAKDWCPLTYADGVTAVAAPIAYRASKAVAEKTAWSFMASHPRATFDLVSLCPAMVFGPFLDTPTALPASPAQLNTSNRLVWDVLAAPDGHAGAVPPTKGPVWIDVRDVAAAHVAALSNPELGGRRLLLAKGVYCSQEVADMARKVVPDEYRARVPVGEPGKREAEGHFGVNADEEEMLLAAQPGGRGKWIELNETLAELAPQLYRIEAAAAVATVAKQ